MEIEFTRERADALLSFARAKNSALTKREIVDVIKEIEGK